MERFSKLKVDEEIGTCSNRTSDSLATVGLLEFMSTHSYLVTAQKTNKMFT